MVREILFINIFNYLCILGYVRVTDFGIARILKPENYQDTSGTPGYMGK